MGLGRQMGARLTRSRKLFFRILIAALACCIVSPLWDHPAQAQVAQGNSLVESLFGGPGKGAPVSLTLPDGQYWVVVASTQNLDEAIGIARRFSYGSKSRVVRASNGWFAVLIGPEGVRKGQGAEFLAKLRQERNIPTDAHLSRGNGLAEQVWVSPDPLELKSVKYDGQHEASLRYGDLEIRLSSVAAADGNKNPVARGFVGGKLAFTLLIDENPNETPQSEVSLIKLDPSSDFPQIVFSYFWQGAHCCTVTRIATHHADTGWQTVAAETIDGEGYGFEDITSDGAGELIGIDNSFLYLFESYAGSFAPIKIQRLTGTHLVDVTKQPAYHHRVLQAVYQKQFSARQDPTIWHSNGFLAGWVAAKILVGEGQEAWQRMLTSYNHDPDFGPEKCTVALPIDSCPDDNRRRIDFPIALKQHLIKQGYITDPDSYATPASSQPRRGQGTEASQASPLLSKCAESLETVRSLSFKRSWVVKQQHQTRWMRSQCATTRRWRESTTAFRS